MKQWIKVGIVENRFEGDRVSQALKEAEIPFVMKMDGCVERGNPADHFVESSHLPPKTSLQLFVAFGTIVVPGNATVSEKSSTAKP